MFGQIFEPIVPIQLKHVGQNEWKATGAGAALYKTFRGSPECLMCIMNRNEGTSFDIFLQVLLGPWRVEKSQLV